MKIPLWNISGRGQTKSTLSGAEAEQLKKEKNGSNLGILSDYSRSFPFAVVQILKDLDRKGPYGKQVETLYFQKIGIGCHRDKGIHSADMV